MGSGSWVRGFGDNAANRPKKTAGGDPAVLGDSVRLFGYALASPPPVRCENQKYAKKYVCERMGAECSTAVLTRL